ncbi:hypothetical protein DFH06DRAFT_1351574 [Mycena polygramma]|nr:hypothetical protein DFH06DRAFT_1351574 [Mycena polygramma]
MAHLARVDCRRLEELYLVLRLSLDPAVVRDRPLFTCSVPALRKLYVSRCLPPTALHFMGETVVDLRLVLVVSHDLQWNHMFRALSAFPKIRYLKLGGVLCANYPPNPRQLVYRHLTHMSLSCFTPSMVSVVSHLVTPALTNLRLVIRDATLVEGLISVFRPRMMRILSLDLCVSASLSSDQMITLLASFIAVRNIDLSSCSIECRAPIMEALGARLLILPHLTRVQIGWNVKSEPQFMTPGLALHLGGITRLGLGQVQFPSGFRLVHSIFFSKDKDKTVANFNSQIWDFSNLFVGGNGTIPTPFGTNPTLTSMCLALRAAHKIAQSLKAGFSPALATEEMQPTPATWLSWTTDSTDPNFPKHDREAHKRV